jgi:hypothetical protein
MLFIGVAMSITVSRNGLQQTQNYANPHLGLPSALPYPDRTKTAVYACWYHHPGCGCWRRRGWMGSFGPLCGPCQCWNWYRRSVCYFNGYCVGPIPSLRCTTRLYVGPPSYALSPGRSHPRCYGPYCSNGMYIPLLHYYRSSTYNLSVYMLILQLVLLVSGKLIFYRRDWCASHFRSFPRRPYMPA